MIKLINYHNDLRAPETGMSRIQSLHRRVERLRSINARGVIRTDLIPLCCADSNRTAGRNTSNGRSTGESSEVGMQMRSARRVLRIVSAHSLLSSFVF
jgi:hypothetical protein